MNGKCNKCHNCHKCLAKYHVIENHWRNWTKSRSTSPPPRQALFETAFLLLSDEDAIQVGRGLDQDEDNDARNRASPLDRREAEDEEAVDRRENRVGYHRDPKASRRDRRNEEDGDQRAERNGWFRFRRLTRAIDAALWRGKNEQLVRAVDASRDLHRDHPTCPGAWSESRPCHARAHAFPMSRQGAPFPRDHLGWDHRDAPKAY